MKPNFIATGAILMALAVIAGAFGAHGLKSKISPEMLEIWEKAVFYQMIHSIGLLFSGILMKNEKEKTLALAGMFFLFGVLFFSGSLYLLSLREISFTSEIASVLGPITPFGGLSFIAGWVCFVVFGIRSSKK